MLPCIMQASCMQRAGRAGRVRPGHAFRLCTEEAYQQLLPDASVPEMQRSDLAGLLLQLKVR
jgi:ATP-dependent RNA helicase DDX35